MLRTWSGERYTPGEEFLERTADLDAEHVSLADTETPTEKMLAPHRFDVDDSYVAVGDYLCRTYCILGWPMDPDAMFLGELFTMRGVDIQTRIHIAPEHKQSVMGQLERLMADVDAEEEKRLSETDASALRIQNDKDAARQMYLSLHNTSAQPWQVLMYVTVRVDSSAATEFAERAGREFRSIDFAKIEALDRACDDVLDVLSSAPAGLEPRTPGNRVYDAFISSTPTARDQYHEDGTRSKRTRMLGGAVGAMFPFCTGTVSEPGGLRMGRNKQNGSLIVADQFQREAAPHILTIGQSRSGKTYGIETAYSEWFAAEDDRTLIVCDTEGGFDALTRICGGKHIIVDGKSNINPLKIQRPSNWDDYAGGRINHYQLKIDEVREFICGILRAQGIDPSPYVATIEDAVTRTYKNAGITHDPETHGKPSPTLQDFIDVLQTMLDEPQKFTFTLHDRETQNREQIVADLLDKLSGFKPHGKYSHLLEGSESGLLDERMAYLDLSQFSEASDAEKSVMLQLMLGQVYEKVKRSPGEVVFLIDEAHHLLHSDEMVAWLEEAARAWARYDACLHFVTQSPREFIERAQSVGDGQENRRRTILEQCSTIQAFRTPRIEPRLLADLGMNENQIDFVKNRATTGKSHRGYSECLIRFQDRRGWWESYVQASPYQDRAWKYTARKHGDFDEYMRQWSEWQ